jgi:4-hydroxy-tetrahydrodipicolinate synthase
MSATGRPAKKAKNVHTGMSVEHIKTLRLMTAIKTPYREDGNIDYAALDAHTAHQVANGVDGLIVGGTTGEGHLLSWEEHLAMIAHIKAKFPTLCIVGNTGGNHTAESVYATKKGFAAGMDCSLLINPYYGKTSKQGIIMHIEAAMKFGPAIIYNVPGRTGQDIQPEVIFELAKHENFCGVKECMGNDRIKLLADKGIMCWSGNDEQSHDGRHNFGGLGVISVTSNVLPGLMKKLMTEKDDAANAKLKKIFGWLFEEPNSIGVNTLLMQLGVCKPVFRLPYTVREEAKRKEVLDIVKEIGIEHFPGKEVVTLKDSDIVYTLSGDDED